jgi:hypothetical protein
VDVATFSVARRGLHTGILPPLRSDMRLQKKLHGRKARQTSGLFESAAQILPKPSAAEIFMRILA